MGKQSNINTPPSKNKANQFSVEDEDSSTNSNDDDSLYEVQSDDHSNDDSFLMTTLLTMYLRSPKENFTKRILNCILLLHLSQESTSK